MRIGIECVHQKDERQTHDKHDVHDGSNMHRGLRLNSGIFVFPQLCGSSLLVFRKKIEDNKTPRSYAKLMEYNTDVKISLLLNQ